MKPVLKLWQDRKYYDLDCRNIFLTLSISLFMIAISKNISFVSQKIKYYYWRKHKKSNFKAFKQNFFDLNQRCSNVQKTVEF